MHRSITLLVVSLFCLISACICATGAGTNVFMVFEGDSLTEGSGASPQGSSNYVSAMLLTSTYGTVVTNVAHGGGFLYNTTNAVDTINQFSSHASYGRLVASLWMGVNDAAAYGGTGDDASVKAASDVICTNTSAWINAVRSSFPGASIMVMTHPTTTLFWAKNAILSNVTTWIRSSAPANLVNDLAADSRLSTWSADYFTDNVHLNNAGYAVVASIVKSNLIAKGWTDVAANFSTAINATVTHMSGQ